MDHVHDGAGEGTAGGRADRAAPEFFRLAIEGPWLDHDRVPIAPSDLPFGARTRAQAEAWAQQERATEGLRDKTGGALIAQRAADEAGVWVMDARGGWHEPGGEAVRVRHDALRFFGEYATGDDALPWWGLYAWPEPVIDRLEAHDLRELGASEELIEAGRRWNARWERWATAGWDEPVRWPGGAEGHAGEGEAIEREGIDLARRTARELPRLWVQDATRQWHAGLLRVGGDGEPDGPYPSEGWRQSGLVLRDGAPLGGAWVLLDGHRDKGRGLPRAWEVPADLEAATDAWLAAHRRVQDTGMFLDLEAIENGDAAAVERARAVRALAEEEWVLAWEALRAMANELGTLSALELGDVSGREYDGWPTGDRTPSPPTTFGRRVLSWAGYAPLTRAALLGGTEGFSEADLADDWDPPSERGGGRR